MKAVLRAMSVVLLVIGIPTVGLATVALAYSWLAPVQPPPSINEGPGMAGLLGWMLLIPGIAASVVGIAMHFGLNANQPPRDVAWTREHRRLW